MKKASETERLTIRMKPEDFKALQKLSVKNHVAMSEIARKYIAEGMRIEKNTDDIDFTRKQIREELNSVMGGYMNRLIKLLVKIGVMTVSMCFFTSKLLYILVARYKDKVDSDTMFSDAKKKAAAYLSLRDNEIDDAYKKIMNDE